MGFGEILLGDSEISTCGVPEGLGWEIYRRTLEERRSLWRRSLWDL